MRLSLRLAWPIALALGVAAGGGCGRGSSVEFDVLLECGAAPVSLDVTVVASPGGSQRVAVRDAAAFFRAGGRLVVIPPPGATRLSATVVGLDAASRPLTTGSAAAVPADGAAVTATLHLGGPCSDGGADAGRVDALAHDGPGSDAPPVDALPMPVDGTNAADGAPPPPDLTSPSVDLTLPPPDLAPSLDLTPPPPDLTPPPPDLTPPCVNLCLKQVPCAVGTTTVSGTVLAPTDPSLGFGNPDPIANALVYVPNDVVLPFADTVGCNQHCAPPSGSPLVSAVSGADGRFVLQNVPVGPSIPIVIQVGRWRREVTVSVKQCVDNPLGPEDSRLPRRHTEAGTGNVLLSDMPRVALVTGMLDPLECALRKIGIADSEFTNPGGGGRVELYVDNGTTIDAATPPADVLFSSATVMSRYDMVLLECGGAPNPKSAAQHAAFDSYTAAGGRVFVEHYNYVWLEADPSYPGIGWAGNGVTPTVDPLPAWVDVSQPRTQLFSKWLQNLGIATAMQGISVNSPRSDLASVMPPAMQWIYRNANQPYKPMTAPYVPMHFTLDTPVASGSGKRCGRVAYADYHVHDNWSNPGGTFPGECAAGGVSPMMTAADRLFEYTLFDLGACE